MCIKPIVKKIDSCKYAGVYSIKVPCGKCLECLRDKQNDWLVRLYMESKYHSNLLFFTLTYSPESVPELVDSDGVVYRTVFKKHLQDWLKRFRQRYVKEFVESSQLKYFITSEYGPSTKRPHYHGLVFGVPYSIFNKLALADWRVNFGFVDCKEVKLSTAFADRDKSISNVVRYVSKYCLKGEFENPFVDERKVFPSFRLISKGIGLQYTLSIKDFVLYGNGEKVLSYTTESIENIIERSKIKIGSCYYSLPVYSKNIIYGQKTLLSYKIGQALLLRDDEVYRNKLSQLQTYGSCSDIQAFRNLSMQEDNTHSIVYSKLKSQFENYYNKSKI